MFCLSHEESIIVNRCGCGFPSVILSFEPACIRVSQLGYHPRDKMIGGRATNKLNMQSFWHIHGL